MLTEDQFKRLVYFVKSSVGIDLSQKRVLVNTRLESYCAKNNIKDISVYLDKAYSSKGQESEELINMLTTNHTFFWREEQHFLMFKNVILPELKQKCRVTKDLRIWCAASSTGEEPYTLAMILQDFFGIEHNEWDTTVLATDISTRVLAVAMTGMYGADSISKLPLEMQQRHFKVQGDVAYIKDNIKSQVLFRKFNLMDPFPFRKKLHVVFCRNVLIYFDDSTKKAIIEKIADNLEIGGYLFIGTTESANRMSDRLEYVAPSVYKRVR